VSAVTILAAGAKANASTSTPVDVSAFSTLRLNAAVLANLGKGPYIDIFIETASASTGQPWRVVWHRFQSTGTPPGANEQAWESATRIVLSGFDSFLRVRWVAVATQNFGMLNGVLDNSVELNLAITGDGKPDAV
jgi:hypothetical protein